MRHFAVVMCLVATVVAHPEAGAGYNYNGLQNGLTQNSHTTSHIHQQLPAEHSSSNFAPSPSYLVPPAAPNPDHLQQLDSLASPVADTQQSNQALNSPAHHEDSYNMAYQQSANSYESGGYPYAQQQTTVHKHIYVHVPPKDFDEQDVITPHVHHQVSPKQKHYKIVFIKAPAAPSIRPPVVPPPPQNEEKTLIYVLHKKPELEQDIIIPTAAPTKPSKPEVFFIKYKTRKEEAPVYGPPPAQQNLGIDPRNIDAISLDFGAPIVDGASPDSSATLTTTQPSVQEISNAQQQQAQKQQEQQQQQQQTQQFVGDVPLEVYGAPTMAAANVLEAPQPTLTAPSNQYLAPQAPQGTMPPIVVEETHEPSQKYGPPNRFFIKKKK